MAGMVAGTPEALDADGDTAEAKQWHGRVLTVHGSRLLALFCKLGQTMFCACPDAIFRVIYLNSNRSTRYAIAAALRAKQASGRALYWGGADLYLEPCHCGSAESRQKSADDSRSSSKAHLPESHFYAAICPFMPAVGLADLGSFGHTRA
ncbi:hypothetical protein B0H13DRAFT_1877420 [Mycena leptocephala]|nr:hypothetical protein B0H13DRAFT_1877420 [Mycena leptocephala]